MNDQLRIVAAAVIHGGVVHTAPHHHLAMWQIACCWGEKAHGDQGFVASDGKFYDRVAAKKIAREAGQIRFPLKHEPDELYSEELWSYADWLKDHKMPDHPDATTPVSPNPGNGPGDTEMLDWVLAGNTVVVRVGEYDYHSCLHYPFDRAAIRSAMQLAAMTAASDEQLRSNAQNWQTILDLRAERDRLQVELGAEREQRAHFARKLSEEITLTDSLRAQNAQLIAELNALKK